MTTRMIHPQHGATHAYDHGQIEQLKKQGWSVETDEPPKRVVGVDTNGDGVIDKVFTEKPADPEKKKPGRPKKK